MHAIAGSILMVLLAIVVLSDLRTRRIPNRLVLAIAACGVIVALPDGWRAALIALSGVGVGLALWLPFHVLRILGAGDVKLAAACGAWLGAAGIAEASVVAAMIGGALALATIAWQRSARGTALDAMLLVSSLRRGRLPAALTIERAPHLMPYGVAIAFGVAAIWWVK